MLHLKIEPKECHHISAVSFDLLLRQAKARYVLGLTATPVRRDGQQPIIFMQCGPIRHEASRPEGAPRSLTVIPRSLATPLNSDSATGIQDIFRQLAASIERTQRIVEDVLSAYRSSRSIIVLTERTDHLNTLERALTCQIENLFALHGRMSRKQRTALLEALEALPGDAPPPRIACHRSACRRRFRSSAARYADAGHADFVERHLAAIRWTPASRARQQNGRADL